MRAGTQTSLLLLLLVATLGCATATPSTAPSEALFGTWRLERYADTPEGQPAIYPFGTAPVGIMIFTRDGYFSVSLMRNPPSPDQGSLDPDPDACVPAWYCSYFGTYSLDSSGRTWTTHVLGGNIANYLGTQQTRAFTIQGDRLRIVEEYAAEGRTVRGERELVRVRPGDGESTTE